MWGAQTNGFEKCWKLSKFGEKHSFRQKLTNFQYLAYLKIVQGVIQA